MRPSVPALDYFHNKAELKPIGDYFSDARMGKITKRGRCKAPMYSIEYWNCFGAILNDDPCTNNAVGGWHHAFHSRTQTAHASMGQFIDAVRGEQAVSEGIMEQYVTGRDIAEKKRRTYTDYEAGYTEDREIVEYFKGIAHNIKL